MTSALKTTRQLVRGLGLTILLLLAGCATGGYGGGYGYPEQGQYPGQSYPDDRYQSQSLTATVEGIDINAQRLLLTEQSSRYGGGSRVEVFFDSNTPLYYQGRTQAIQNLERGDVVRVQTAQSGGRLWARTIEVIRNVRDGNGGGQYGNDRYGNELRGAVGYVDQRTRVIEITHGSYGNRDGAGAARVRYDDRTTVEYQGRRFRPENLERGDQVRIQARQSGNEWLAERIWVERSVRER